MSIGIVIVLSTLIIAVNCSTHWVVTEEGKVQEQLESPYAIKQSHDLVAFMKQEGNHEKLRTMKEKLIGEKNAIEESEDKDFDLESRHYRQDEDCKLAGKPLADFDLYVSSLLPLENKDIQVLDHIDTIDSEEDSTNQEPDCTKHYSIPGGELPYDDLEGVVSRKHMHYLPETGIRAALKYMDTEQKFANAIDSALAKNSSSWVVYNLATFYWRMKGNPTQALECVRRALYFSPRKYKDVALVNLANILHRSHYSLNASAVMMEALEISTDFNVNHFTLGSIYAALSRYNESILYFTKTIEAQPGFDAAKNRLHAVKCEHKLQQKLEAQHASLKSTLRELEAYQEKHKKYMELYLSAKKTQLSRQEQINMHYLLMQHLIKHGLFDHKLCKFRSGEDGPVVFCELPTPSTDFLDVLLSEEDKSGHVLDTKPKENSSGTDSENLDTTDDSAEQGISFWNYSAWPTDEQCTEYAPRTLAWDEYPSSFIDLEERGGISVKSLLEDYIGLPEGETAPKPWTELDCATLEPATTRTPFDKITGVGNGDSILMHKQDSCVKKGTLIHTNEKLPWPGDLGHRLHTAITKSLANDDGDTLWVLYNYAGLYFRVLGDNSKAAECIRRASHYAPAEHYDSVLINMANIMYRLGKVNDALTLLIEALGVNNTEPATYLAVGNALQAKGNSSGAVTFYEYALMLHSNYSEALYALLNAKCAARREKTTLDIRNRKKYEDTRVQEDPMVALNSGDDFDAIVARYRSSVEGNVKDSESKTKGIDPEGAEVHNTDEGSVELQPGMGLGKKRLEAATCEQFRKGLQ